MTVAYVLTKAAEQDIRSILRYTRQQWGEGQMRAYMSALEQGIAQLAAGQGAYRDMGAMREGLRMARCRHHYIFALGREDGPTLILAILHEKMDLIARLGDRLG
ncbi:type II toxin-antitoxin system RelE/ParE family toxin [Novosphingobium humi]|uniref:type II toxin-antitoxin system RelE/ParE family toxin n=1 Tax=Novosphingobium humi TaxID=2282397 RepID=UPI0025B21014|nr:type II toxin-antitoxin system RelE/ParE family toxin [Novosphingobium humi]WJT01119.1 type II toxin-antitoxin system RelE/ParE family toxin [Novosphingobium humi]